MFVRKLRDVDPMLQIILRSILGVTTLALLALEFLVLPVEIMTVGKAQQYGYMLLTILVITEIAIKATTLVFNLLMNIEYNSMFKKHPMNRLCGYIFNGLFLIITATATLIAGFSLSKVDQSFVTMIMNYGVINLGLVLLNSLIAIGILLTYEYPEEYITI